MLSSKYAANVWHALSLSPNQCKTGGGGGGESLENDGKLIVYLDLLKGK